MTKASFTGYRRRREVRPRVRAAEFISTLLITVGGIGTVLAVTLIFVFLLAVVLPLFRSASVDDPVASVLAEATPGGVLHLAVDEHLTLAAVLREEGVVETYRVDTGELLERRQPFAGSRLTAVSFLNSGDTVAFGFQDGSVRVGEFGFEGRLLDEQGLPGALAELTEGQVAVHDGGVVTRTQEGRLRHVCLVTAIGDPQATGDASPIVLLDHSPPLGGKTVLATLSATGSLRLFEGREKRNFLTGETTVSLRDFELPFDAGRRGTPQDLVLMGLGDNLLITWADGEALRYDTRDPEAPAIAETVDLTPQGEELTALETLVGKGTVIAGDSAGRVRAWFLVKSEDAGTIDGSLLVEAHSFEGPVPEQASAVVALAPSSRSRLLAVGLADGTIDLLHVTSEQRLGRTRLPAGQSVRALAMAPREDGIVGLSDESFATFAVDPRHPEASLAALFLPVWYENYAGAEAVWQSSGATDDFEPKLGMWPLVFGTLKATLYSMLFGTPLAILAAIFTSEFLDKRLRSPIKSIIEMMASLPSVVLGFLAAIVIAPWVQEWVPACLAMLLTLPVSLLLGAYLWQLLPQGVAIRLAGWPRLAVIACALPVSVVLALVLGPAVEHLLFGGEVELWLAGGSGDAAGGWMIGLLPLSFVLVALAMGRWLQPWLRARTGAWERRACARLDLGRFLAWGVGSLALAWVGSSLLASLSLDARGLYLGTYVQRNAMIVGFVMGFAVIPIIYTIAEDALSSVPGHLRLASLGCGATPWQTAVRVVVPTAMSGIFSAVMIGLGRAVGETMIVLMATGNTPVTDFNVFSGFRTLSANIAVELPEAVRNSTHYRTLFLAALVLFALTFAVNTLAEIVRQRFRKRAYQL